MQRFLKLLALALLVLSGASTFAEGNVTDAQGKPYSGVDDRTFLADLDKAAQSYAVDKVEITGIGRADARFIENDWRSAPDGEDYAKRLGEGLTQELKTLRAEHDAGLAEAMTEN